MVVDGMRSADRKRLQSPLLRERLVARGTRKKPRHRVGHPFPNQACTAMPPESRSWADPVDAPELRSVAASATIRVADLDAGQTTVRNFVPIGLAGRTQIARPGRSSVNAPLLCVAPLVRAADADCAAIASPILRRSDRRQAVRPCDFPRPHWPGCFHRPDAKSLRTKTGRDRGPSRSPVGQMLTCGARPGLAQNEMDSRGAQTSARATQTARNTIAKPDTRAIRRPH